MKTQTTLRFDSDLLALVREKAKAQKRSLNNYIEYLLYKDVGDIPNEETIKAINQAENNQNLETIEDVDTFINES
ncbi:MAG: hypothetical protein COB81_01310 [Flavobacteriaceae bacterium]|nr:MAG: hypothetical protein COB81_01310 [Flavobacteriaceae bacterium]